MTALNSEITYFDGTSRSQLPPTLLDFLRSLNGLTVFDIAGKDTTRCRVVTTLIHGNEPSGMVACHLWLKSQEVPATNIRIIICNPEAAKEKPCFTNRYVEKSDDLNRFFSVDVSNQSPVAVRARKITELVQQVKPEAVIDLHNTSGIGPAFAVSVKEEREHLCLAESFTNDLILTNLHVGAIMEQDFSAPIITIECGGANDNASHQLATNGLHQYFCKNELFASQAPSVSVLRHPMRVELTGDASVGFAHHRLATTDITLRADIEELNKDVTPANEFIGWCDCRGSLIIKAIDAHGVNQIERLFENRNGSLFTRKEMRLFMVTTIAEIATKDCLFYVTE